LPALNTIKSLSSGTRHPIAAILRKSDTVYTHESEWVNIPDAGIDQTREDNPNLFKFEWFNVENGFGMDYVMSGMVGKAYIESKLIYGQAAGDSVIFDNQGEEVKLKEIVQRVMMLSCEVPAYLAEQITLWMAHDQFFINDVQYINSKKPTIQQRGNSNIYQLVAELKQTDVIGINTHDTGFDCDTANNYSMILNIPETGIIQDFSEDLPAGYLLHMATLIWTSGTGTIILGTTAEDDDIFTEKTVSSANPVQTVECNHHVLTAQTVYATVTGTVVFSCNMQLIKNTSL